MGDADAGVGRFVSGGLTPLRYHLAAIGHARSGPEQALFEMYRARLVAPLTLKELEEKRPLPDSVRIAREGVLLLGEIQDGALTVALDEAGREMDSEAFAAFVQGAKEDARPVLTFLIGGADGHDRAVRERADVMLSFGRMTWPHMLVRALLAEQLYRAERILANHPYHRR